ncbi:N-methylhydantoinase A [Cribrihabitans marinus]|uniref:N-methylhydantoinase A n=1 Tax=Cribrihabitans marinus TaxID=1227549 RepID=A0A1H7DGV6_9RHOB|nr:hydantoinase/oxoprolinase family protein [Cribrihabitans marinus]GGH38260.1 methylhydantoinase [Cribrihabitans marinus]SEJ98470.1 N-methylhydantoinase A [Cribrihabitans marinus]
MNIENGLRLAVDIGGTFTDSVLADVQGRIIASTKTPTTPENPALGALEGARRVMSQADADWSKVMSFIHGTTLATNALIERRGAVVATVTTEGFRDILEIANERRYSPYDINLVKPDLIVPRSRAFTIGGRMNAGGHVLRPLDEASVSRLADQITACNAGAVAICLLHAYADATHELRLRELLKALLPDLVISLSHEVSPEAREFDRLSTTIANAYIQPLIAGYLGEFQTRFAREGLTCPILMMTAGGGMSTMETAARLPIRLVESGPAGGAILAARVAAETGAREVLSFDMGGTTAKLCLIDDFRPQTARKFEIARAARFIRGSGMPVRIPVIEMIEIGAGGGSIAHVDRLGRLQVGPESAGSMPGPAAFARGGADPTVTDADVVQGLIEPGRFAEGRLAIDVDAAKSALERVVGAALELGAARAAHGISEIVDGNMANAGRMHAVESGKDLGTRLMIAFGGNGPLHATRVARRAGIERILIPRDPGVGSAVGFLHAPVSYEIVRTRYVTVNAFDLDGLNAFFKEMTAEARAVVRAGAPEAALKQRRLAFMRYRGQGHEVEVALPDRTLKESDIPDLRRSFEKEYSRQFSRTVPDMPIEILNWSLQVSTEPRKPERYPAPTSKRQVRPTGRRSILCDVTGEWCEADVHDRAMLRPGDFLNGPALIIEPQTTTFVSADFSAHLDSAGNIWLVRNPEEKP